MFRIIAAVMALSLVAVSVPATHAQLQSPATSLAGRWQGELNSQGQTVRIVLRLEEHAPGSWSCFVNFIGRNAEANRCNHVTIDGPRILVTVEFVGARLEAALSDGGASLVGTYASPTAGSQALRLVRADEAAAWPLDPAPHRQTFVTTSDGVRLEVLDYGGQGPALMFIPGLGASGHVFDAFAPRLTDTHRVYAISRRGYGESERPEATAQAYGSRRLGDDVVEVMDALKIERAALAGWSIGGVELASVATRFPERASGVVYLDAAYAYTFYAPGNQQSDFNVNIGVNDLTQRIAATRTMEPAEGAKAIETILATTLPNLAQDLALYRESFVGAVGLPISPPAAPAPTPAAAAGVSAPALPAPTIPSVDAVGEAITRNVERLPAVTVPVLSIYADGERPIPAPSLLAVSLDRFVRDLPALRARFQAAHPQARVVVLPGADHAVFRSNPDDVLREMRTFLAGLRF